MRYDIACLCLLVLSLPSVADENPTDGESPSREELDKWFEEDTPKAETNLGELDFLDTLPTDKSIHHHQNWIKITADTLESGWTQLEQCHEHLDQVSSLQITFRAGYVRDLKVTEKRNIDQAWVENSSVQLKNIGENAKICLQAHTRALKKTGDGYYSLSNGPYMRKFLDGYFPMHVSMQISYPEKLLQLVSITPDTQPGFKVEEDAGQINFDAIFAGELRTNIQFQQTNTAGRNTAANQLAQFPPPTAVPSPITVPALPQ